MPTIQEFTGTKTSDMPTAGTITGDELITVVQDGTSVQTTLTATASTGYKISRAAGTATVETDGSIALSSAPTASDGGVKGVVIASPDMGSPGTVGNPPLTIQAGEYQAGPALRIKTPVNQYPNLGTQAIGVRWAGWQYPDVDRFQVNVAGAILCQAETVMSGTQVATDGDPRGVKGSIIYPFIHQCMHYVWPDVQGGILQRVNSGFPAGHQASFAISDTGDNSTTDGSTNWIFGINGDGSIQWGTQPTKVGATLHWPYEMTGPKLEYGGGTHLGLTGNFDISADLSVGGDLLISGPTGVTTGSGVSGPYTGVASDYYRWGNSNLNQNVSGNAALIQGPTGDTELGSPVYALIRVGGSVRVWADTAGLAFFGTTPIAKPTATACTSSTALVNLGLMTAGTGPTLASGVLFNSTAPVSSSTSGDADAFTHTFPAGIWAADKDTALVYADGTFATSGSTNKRVLYSLGGTVLFDSGALTVTPTTTWTLTGRITRIGSSSLRCTFRFSSDNGGSPILVKVPPTNYTLTLSGTLAGKVTLTQTTAVADTVFDYGLVEWVPAA